MKTLLEKTRKLNCLFQCSSSEIILFNDICKLLGDILNSNVFIINTKGKILGEISKQDNPFVDVKTGNYTHINEQLNAITETKENLNSTDFSINTEYKNNYIITIIPINCAGNRQGTLLFYKPNGTYSIEDTILGEYVVTIVGLEIVRSNSAENTEQYRKNSIVKSAISTLSYSELEAVLHIFNELNGIEGLVVASRIADKVGITRSVIVNALRKFESAGIIESRSLGMKGTYIKVLNNLLLEELNKLKK